MAGLMVAMVWAASERSLWAVQALLVLRTFVAGFFHPAKQAALRALVEDDELVDANALDAATWSVTFTLGTALGGLIAMAGPVTALVVDGLTFVVAALVLARLPGLPSEARSASRIHPSELAVALQAALPKPGLLEAVFTKAPLAVAGGGTWLLLNLTAERAGLWGSAALALGMLQAVRGVGTGVGPLLSKKLVARGFSSRHLLRLSVWISFLSMAAFTLTASSGAGMAALAVTALAWGMGGGGTWVFSATEMQRQSPRSVLGRLSSIDMLAFTLGQGISAMAGAWLVDATGVLSGAGWLGLALGLGLYAVVRLGARSRKPATPVTTPFAPAPPR
jgi:predicted MFS family arabinose efflux permease